MSEKYINYQLSGLKEDASLHNNRVVCPICKSELESKGISDYFVRNLQIDDDYRFGYCFRCKNKFLEEGREVDVIKFYTSNVPDHLCISSVDFSIYEGLTLSDKGLEYLINRCKYYTKSFLDELHIKSDDKKIIIPFFFNKRVIYYQVRYINPKQGGLRYFNPPIENKPFFITTFNKNKDTIIVEGVFDALAIMSIKKLNKYNIIGLLGSTMSNYQYKLFKYLLDSKNIIIFLDDLDKSYNLAKNIKLKKFKGGIEIIRAYHNEDPEELLHRLDKEEFIKYINVNRDIYQKKKNITKRIIEHGF